MEQDKLINLIQRVVLLVGLALLTAYVIAILYAMTLFSRADDPSKDEVRPMDKDWSVRVMM